MRAAAAAGDYESFAQGVPTPALAQKMYDAVRKGMGIKDEVPAQEGIRPEKPSKSSDDLIAMGYAPDSDKVQSAREYEDWVDDQRAKGKEPVEEAQLNEAFPLLIPALAAAVRIGAPMVSRMITSQGAKQAAKVVAKNTGNVAKATGKAVIKNPGKTALAVGGYEVYDTVSDAMDWLKELDVAEELIKPLAQVMIKYALPVAAVLAILYGGKKLYDYIQDNPDDKQPANEILGFATKNQKTTTIKKKRPPEEDSVKDKLAKRRAMAAKGNLDAYKTGAVK